MARSLLINFTWNVADETSPQPFLMLYDSDKGLIKKSIAVDEVISGRIFDDITCIGHEKDKGVYVPCTTLNSPQKGYVRCYSCARNDFFTCRTYCTGKQCLPSSLRAKELCTPPETVVYLTAVGNVVKVGVSLNPLKRWLDQGSLFGVALYRAPGLEARRIENDLSRFLNITKTVTFSSKLRSLPSLNLEKARTRLEKAIEKSKQFKQHEEFRVSDPVVHDLTPHYGEFMSIHHLPQDIHTNQDFSGVIRGFLGKIILLENNKTYLALNLKKFLGHWCELGAELKKMKGQLSLNSFFG